MAKKRVTEPQFPVVSEIIKLRGVQIYGSMNRLALSLGMTRQALFMRVRSASRWHLTHAWWSAILSLPIDVLESDSVGAALAVPVPSQDDLARILQEQSDVWASAYGLRGTWGVHQKIAE
jgi:hypothetical protein